MREHEDVDTAGLTSASGPAYSEPIEMADNAVQEDLRCDYDPYHLYALDNGYNQDLHKEFYDSEDRLYHTGAFVEEDAYDIPLEFLDDMLDEGWLDGFDWDTMNADEVDMLMTSMNEIDDFDHLMPEFDPNNEYIYDGDEGWAEFFDEALWGDDIQDDVPMVEPFLESMM